MKKPRSDSHSSRLASRFVHQSGLSFIQKQFHTYQLWRLVTENNLHQMGETKVLNNFKY